MELNLAELERDWIDGISGAAFVARVQDCRVRIAALTPEEQARGVLLTETDPIQFAAAFFAGVSLGVPVILANPNWGTQEQAELRSLVSPAICFGRGFTCEDRIRVSATGRDSGSAVFTSEAPTGSILIPTGGSTGGVKLAIHTWDSLAAACRGVQTFLGGGAIDSCCVLPLYHVSGLMQLLRAHFTRGHIRFDEDEVAGRCLSYVPTQLQRALSSEARIQKLATARAIFVGGAALPESIAQQARAKELPIIPVYGMTETAAMVAAVPVQDFLENPDAGAVPMGEARFQIESDGRLRILSPALFHGYQGQPPIERAAGYLTDDEARLDDDGRLRVIGRIDRLINSGGEKIDPREVEVAVAKLHGVDEVLAVGLPDPEWGQKLVVYYTGAEVTDWKQRLRAQLVNFKIPKEMRWVDRLPLDEKGKIVGDVENTANVGARLVTPASAQATSDQVAPNQTDRFYAGVTSRAPTPRKLAIRKTHHLYKGRRSAPGSRYFITLCSQDRKPSLLDPALAESILNIWRLQHVDGDYTFHCGTVMPDHIHFLFTLGDRISLGQCIIKFKAKTKAALEVAGLEWQRDFYDHWLRADDSMEGFAKYIYLNPYQKSLLAVEESWPYWQLSREYRPEFVQHLDDNAMPPEAWIINSVGAQELIETDTAAGEFT